ncbi:MAG: cytochrome [Caulobacter sp.]|nr:cytochrome [Caulobacter sp.]
MPNQSPFSGMSLLESEIQDHLFAFYEQLHEHDPVYLMPETGIYILTRYEDVRTALMDTETFSSRSDFGILQGEGWAKYQKVLADDGWANLNTLQSIDPPEHGRYRRLLDRTFNARRVEALRPRLEEVANLVIDEFIDAGECDFIQAFAIPYPGLIISEQFGFELSEIATFRKWSRSLANSAGQVLSAEALLEAAKLELEMQHFLASMIEDRRANPKDDLISRLVHANEEGDSSEPPLSMQEMQSVMRQVITGGYGTLTGAFTNGLHLLLNNPEQMLKLRADRSLMKGFIEESIRIETSVQGLMRKTTRDVEVSGRLIPKDSRVIVRYGAANHDAAKFKCPHEFDVTRENASAHLGFGAGPHFCVGRVLARNELTIGFNAILDRMADIELSRPLQAPNYMPSLIHRLLRELPIKFTAVR